MYVHSGCSSPAWFAWWVSQLRARVSRDHRKNLKALSVVHPTFAVRAFFFAARPFVSAKFWEKLHYVDRIDELFLDDIIPKQYVTRVLPVSVVNGEKHMVEEDVEIARQMAIAAGATLTPRQ